MATRNLDEIIKQWRAVQRIRPVTVPGWCWARPYAHEPYYSFMHLLTQMTEAKLVVELGIDTGTSSIFLATASPQTKVISVEVSAESVHNLQTIANVYGLSNLTIINGSSTAPDTVEKIKAYGPIDVLFIDTLHTFAQASSEYNLYSPLMSSDGVVAHDDIYYSLEMEQYWKSLPAPKREMPELHWTGFGITGGA